jgi:hypothetical protein
LISNGCSILRPLGATPQYVQTENNLSNKWLNNKIWEYQGVREYVTFVPVSERYLLSWNILFHWLYSPLGLCPLLSSFMIIFADGRTPWTSDQLVARPLPLFRTTQTQNKHMHTQNIHALCGIRTHDPGFRASEDSTCLRPLGYRDRRAGTLLIINFNVSVTIAVCYKHYGFFQQSHKIISTENITKSPLFSHLPRCSVVNSCLYWKILFVKHKILNFLSYLTSKAR